LHLHQVSGDIEVILYLRQAAPVSYLKVPGVRLIVNWRHGTALGPLQARVNEARIRRLNPLVFHSTYYSQPSWPGMKQVVTAYDFIDETLPVMSRNVPGFSQRKRKCLESADSVIAISEATKEGVLEHASVPADRIHVIYPGVRTSSPTAGGIRPFRTQYGVKTPYWLYVGDRAPYKNFSALLRACAILRQKSGEHTQLVVISPLADPLDEWQREFLIRSSMERDVIMLSRVTDEELDAAYRGATALVYPSLAEGFGFPVVEAMARQVPVIVADIPVMREVTGGAALFFDPHSPEALAETMRQCGRLANMPAMLERARVRASEFSCIRCARDVAELYLSLMRGDP
jgi:glycosyltransferase involved in cell wall biosynthesis